MNSLRSRLLVEVLGLVRGASQLHGIVRIALIGSLNTGKPDPKDFDLLVTVTDEMDLAPLAKLGRKFSGHAVNFGKGGEIFISDPQRHYLGRICHWERCGPGIRISCDALHCGQRHYLHDDLKIIRLSEDLIAAPPIELWPQIVTRVQIPADVEQILFAPLKDPVQS